MQKRSHSTSISRLNVQSKRQVTLIASKSILGNYFVGNIVP